MNKQFNGFRLRTVSALVAMAFVANAAWSVDPFTVTYLLDRKASWSDGTPITADPATPGRSSSAA